MKTKEIIQELKALNMEDNSPDVPEEIFHDLKDLADEIKDKDKRNKAKEVFEEFLEEEEVIPYLLDLFVHSQGESDIETVNTVKKAITYFPESSYVFYKNNDGVLFGIRYEDVREIRDYMVEVLEEKDDKVSS